MNTDAAIEPIAVVIPCHDDGATLGQAVGSALRQDVPVEVIVVDDGSSDAGTAAVLECLASDGVRVIRQVNRGPGPARMAGLRATGAEYALPLDADDRLPPGALRLLRDALEAHPAAAADWGSARHFGALDFVQPSLPALDPWHLTYQNHLPLSALYRREAVLSAGGWQLDGGYEDWDLWMALAERGWKGIGIPEITGYYRVHAGRRLASSSRRHAERYARLRSRHALLFAERRHHRRASPAPRLLKATLPALHALPLSPTRKRLLAGAVSHVAYGDGWVALVARYHAYRFLRGSNAR